ncbi:MAG: prepilin-type N-terminal cleavage/methylation domain-containing protein, partial [Gammaproteobacteria bacterium]|nr:prepilin-type N-terminal cleavage/methylation domain-containing protein [Gammaproteobacteria bacterium]
MSTRGRSRGFSVVELMIAVALSAILLGGVLTVLYSSRVTYDENARLARLQEFGRSGIEMMLRDMRGAGYIGCNRGIDRNDAVITVSTAPPGPELRYNFRVPVMGFEGTAGPLVPALDAGFAPNQTPNNDAIIVRTISDSLPVMSTSAAMSSPTAAVPVRKPAGTVIPQHQMLVISDCEHVAYFANTATTGTGTLATLPHDVAASSPANTTADLGKAFPEGSVVAAVDSVGYYVGDSPSGRGSSLYRVVGRN